MYRKTLLSLFFSIFLINFVNAIENKILFKVDDKIITSIDILYEIEYLSLINKDLKNFKKSRIYDISKNSLIREKIKEIEIEKRFKELKVEDKYIDQLIKNFYTKQGHSSVEKFEEYIAKKNIKLAKIKKKITAEMLWNQLIFAKFGKNIKIDKELIKKEVLNDNNENNIQTEYELSEIVFNIEKKENLNQKFNLIKETIEANGFDNAALSHSNSQTSNNGGYLGWIKKNSLSKKIKDVIQDTNINKFTDPIVVPGGFMILKVNNLREKEKILDIEKEIQLIAIEKRNEQLNQYSNIYFNSIKKNIEINEL